MGSYAVVATVQSSVGALFGVSGTVVVIVVIGLAIAASDANDKKRAAGVAQKTVNAQRSVIASGAGVVAAPIMTGIRSQLCADNNHHLCGGRCIDTSKVEHACTCTCHAVTISNFCRDADRHDLCNGAVAIGVLDGVGVRICGCTCHVQRPGVRRAIDV